MFSNCFVRGPVKLCLKNLDIGTLLQKIVSLSSIVLSQCSAKKFEHYSISAREFCKDVRKFVVSCLLNVNELS